MLPNGGDQSGRFRILKKKKSKRRKNKLKTMWKNKAWVSFTGVLVLSGDFLFLEFVVPFVKLTQ